MKYLLLIYMEEGAQFASELAACYRDSAQFARELAGNGKYLGAHPLHPSSTATTLRLHGDKRILVDGPFAETREQLGGYFLIDAVDLDEALSIAAALPSAKFSTIEVRPVLEISGLPD